MSHQLCEGTDHKSNISLVLHWLGLGLSIVLLRLGLGLGLGIVLLRLGLGIESPD